MEKVNQGFSLIELVLVIVILGVIGAVALPKFSDLSQDARRTSILSAAAAIKTAAVLVHTKVQTSGASVSATLSQVDIGGGNMIEVQNGYPACTANGIIKATGFSNQYIWYAGGGSTCTLYPNVGKDAGGNTVYMNNCAVVYQNDVGGTWTPVTSGC